MFSKKARRERPARRTPAERAADRARDGGYSGLEGDFESERRRAAMASHENIEPYEHGEADPPVLPSTTAGLTHP
jgi:hypothetical protein